MPGTHLRCRPLPFGSPCPSQASELVVAPPSSLSLLPFSPLLIPQGPESRLGLAVLWLFRAKGWRQAAEPPWVPPLSQLLLMGLGRLPLPQCPVPEILGKFLGNLNIPSSQLHPAQPPGSCLEQGEEQGPGIMKAWDSASSSPPPIQAHLATKP